MKCIAENTAQYLDHDKWVGPGLYFIKDENFVKSDLGKIIHFYNIELLFLSQT